MVKKYFVYWKSYKTKQNTQIHKRLFGYEYYQEVSGFEGKVFLREGSVQIKTTEMDVALAHHKN